MNTLFKKRKSLDVTEASPSYKVKYLGNVATSLAQGEACMDKPVGVLWNNFVKTNGAQSVPMKLTVDNAGLKVSTSSQGETQYWCHRVSRFAVPEGRPRLFAWVYRHVGKRMKAELRCHAVLFESRGASSASSAASEKRAADVSRRLGEKKAASLHEYLREKSRRHKTRLVLDRAQATVDADVAFGAGVSGSPHSSTGPTTPVRKRLLNPGRNYKPPVEYSLRPPPLDVIQEAADDSEEPSEDGSPPLYVNGGRLGSLAAFRIGSHGRPGDVSPDGSDECMTPEPLNGHRGDRPCFRDENGSPGANGLERMDCVTTQPLSGGALYEDMEDDDDACFNGSVVNGDGASDSFTHYRSNGCSHGNGTLSSSEESLDRLDADTTNGGHHHHHKPNGALANGSLSSLGSESALGASASQEGFPSAPRSRSADDLMHSSVLASGLRGPQRHLRTNTSPRNGDINSNEEKLSPLVPLSFLSKSATSVRDESQFSSTLPSQRGKSGDKRQALNGSAGIAARAESGDSSASPPTTPVTNGNLVRLHTPDLLVIGSPPTTGRSNSFLTRKGLFNLWPKKKQVTLNSYTLPKSTSAPSKMSAAQPEAAKSGSF